MCCRSRLCSLLIGTKVTAEQFHSKSAIAQRRRAREQIVDRVANTPAFPFIGDAFDAIENVGDLLARHSEFQAIQSNQTIS